MFQRCAVFPAVPLNNITSQSTEVAVFELKSPPPPPQLTVTVTLFDARLAVTQLPTKSISFTVQEAHRAVPSSLN